MTATTMGPGEGPEGCECSPGIGSSKRNPPEDPTIAHSTGETAVPQFATIVKLRVPRHFAQTHWDFQSPGSMVLIHTCPTHENTLINNVTGDRCTVKYDRALSVREAKQQLLDFDRCALGLQIASRGSTKASLPEEYDDLNLKVVIDAFEESSRGAWMASNPVVELVVDAEESFGRAFRMQGVPTSGSLAG